MSVHLCLTMHSSPTFGENPSVHITDVCMNVGKGKGKTPIVNRTLSELCVCWGGAHLRFSWLWAGSEPKLSYMGGRPDLFHVLPLPSQRCSRYQIILFGDRGTCVWTTCPRSLPGSASGRTRTCNLWVTSLRCYQYTTKPHYAWMYMHIKTKKCWWCWLNLAEAW